MLPLRTLCSLFLLPFITLVASRGLFESDLSGLARRQNGAGSAVGGNICARVNLTLTVNVGTQALPVSATVPIAQNVCLCAAGGVLTPASIATITTDVSAAGLSSTVLAAAGGLTGATQLVEQQVLPVLLGEPTTCRSYPANSVPNSCTSCTYSCFSNSTVTYVPCGNQCILQGQPCVSGNSGRRRSLDGQSVDTMCRKGFEACMIPEMEGKSSFPSGDFECIRTAVDLESCGGCVFPLPGRPRGQDCTAIEQSTSVSCDAGRCVVESCESGYILNDDASACVQDQTLIKQAKVKGYWDVLHAAAIAADSL